MCYLYGVHLSPLGFAACQSKKCTNTAVHAAWVGAEQAATERSDSHLCKCTHNKRITTIISFLLFVNSR